jgi:hypothetical protein
MILGPNLMVVGIKLREFIDQFHWERYALLGRNLSVVGIKLREFIDLFIGAKFECDWDKIERIY